MLSSKSRAYRLCGLSQEMAIEKKGGEWKGKKGEKEEERKDTQGQSVTIVQRKKKGETHQKGDVWGFTHWMTTEKTQKIKKGTEKRTHREKTCGWGACCGVSHQEGCTSRCFHEKKRQVQVQQEREQQEQEERERISCERQEGGQPSGLCGRAWRA